MSIHARAGIPHRVPLVPDAVPRLGATPELRDEFRAMTRRLLAYADSLPPSAERAQESLVGQPLASASRFHPGGRPRPVAVPLARRRPTAAAAASNPATRGAERIVSGGLLPARPQAPSTLPLARDGGLRLRSADDLATALDCRALAGTGDDQVLVRQLRVRIPEALDWVRSLPVEGVGKLLATASPGDGPRGTLFLDIETAGLANAPVLLVGVARAVGSRLVLRQYLATDYPSEQAMLRAVARELARSARVVTFNGASFDLPAVRDRSILWGLPAQRMPEHIDLLPHARRAWRGLAANCRLGTLEAVILGRVRSRDLPSREVPEAFHRFVRTGDPSVVAPILRHNAFDVISMAGLAVTLGVPL